MTQAEHTKEPWSVDPISTWSIRGDGHKVVTCASNEDGDALDNANAAHVVLCVNACAGLNPEAIPAAIEALEKIKEGDGRFNRDPLEHASNCIEDMKALAVHALAAVKEVQA